jgi:hypothetical protein
MKLNSGKTIRTLLLYDGRRYEMQADRNPAIRENYVYLQP